MTPQEGPSYLLHKNVKIYQTIKGDTKLFKKYPCKRLNQFKSMQIKLGESKIVGQYNLQKRDPHKTFPNCKSKC